jgi:hypothetical protein
VPRPSYSEMSDSERIVYCTRWLVAHPDAPLVERVAYATVIACGGSVEGECSFGDIALYLDASPRDVLQALFANRERVEAEREAE